MSKRITGYKIEYWLNKGYTKNEAKIKIEEYKKEKRKDKPICLDYWLNKGYTESQAKQKVSEVQSKNSNKRKNKYAPSQKIFWINQGYSEEQANKKSKENIRKTNPLCKESWLNKGYSQEEAKNKVKEYQKRNNRKFLNKKDKNPEKYKHIYTTKIEYWLNKGYTENEAKKKLNERQKTFTLEKCKQRYGKKEGYRIWKERQKRWQETINKKYTKAEQKKWCSFTYEDYKRKYGKEKADIWLKNKFSYGGKTYAKISKDIFAKLDKIFKNRVFYYAENEKTIIINSKNYIVDFYDPQNKKIIEFNGDLWHLNPIIYNKNDKNPINDKKAEDIWKKDEIRINELNKHYDVLVIWENEFNKNKQNAVNKCINFLNN